MVSSNGWLWHSLLSNGSLAAKALPTQRVSAAPHHPHLPLCWKENFQLVKNSLHPWQICFKPKQKWWERHSRKTQDKRAEHTADLSPAPQFGTVWASKVGETGLSQSLQQQQPPSPTIGFSLTPGAVDLWSAVQLWATRIIFALRAMREQIFYQHLNHLSSGRRGGALGSVVHA